MSLYESRIIEENESLREEAEKWRTVAARWACCKAGLVAAPDPCPWHGDGIRRTDELGDKHE